MPAATQAQSVAEEGDDLDFMDFSEDSGPAGKASATPAPSAAKPASRPPNAKGPASDDVGADAAAAIADAVASMMFSPQPAPPQAAPKPSSPLDAMMPSMTEPAPAQPKAVPSAPPPKAAPPAAQPKAAPPPVPAKAEAPPAKPKTAAPAAESAPLAPASPGNAKTAGPAIEKTWMPEGRNLAPEKAAAAKAPAAPAAPSRPRGSASAGPSAPLSLAPSATQPAPAPTPAPAAVAKPAAAPAPKPVAAPVAEAKPVAAARAASAAAPIEVSAPEPKPPAAIEQAAMQFANGQADAAAKSLKAAIAANNLGESAVQAWLMLFDLYQVLGRKEAHDELALEFVVKLERSAPAWRDEPKQAAKDLSLERGAGSYFALTGSLSAASKAEIEQLQKAAEKGALLRVEFGKLKDVDADGAQLLLDTLKAFGKARRELVLSNHKTMLALLAPKTEVGNKDNPHVYWMLVLALYQVLGLQTEFEDTALNFAITYELSPPSFEEPAKAAKAEAASADTTSSGDGAIVLAGELCGSDDDELARFAKSAAAQADVVIDMAQVKRVDAVAANLMLTTITALAAAHKPVQIRFANELISALFQVVGITRYAKLVRRR
jgi:ABC-type transporter Mla MlaB component